MGLSTNELVTNALKYAFPDGRPGRIDVELRRDGEWVSLAVRDDGVGMDPREPPKGGGLGRKLIEQLVAENGGSLSIVGGTGVAVLIKLPRHCGDS